MVPPLLLVTLAGVAELILALGPDPRLRFFDRVAGGDGADEFVASPHPPSKSAGFRTRRFPVAPPSGARRILCLGDSTMHGLPFDPPVPFPSWLERRLRHLLPDRSFELVNAAAPGMCSEDVLDVLEELDGAHASLLLVHVGHNEFLDVNLSRTVKPWAHALRRLATRSRVGALLLACSDRPAAASRSAVRRARLDVVEQPRLSAAERDRGMQRWRSHLEAIARFARARAIPVVFLQPISEWVDEPPNDSAFAATTDATRRAEFRAELALVLGAGAWFGRTDAQDDEPTPDPLDAATLATCFGRLDRMQAIAPEVALTAWLRGRLELGRGEVDAARRAFQESLDRDACPTRVPPRHARVLTEVARANGAVVVDPLPLFLAEVAPELPTQHRLFTDAVHPDERGHELLADALLHALADASLLAPAAEWRFAEEPTLAAYREQAGLTDAARAAALARTAFLVIGELLDDPSHRARARYALRQLDAALRLDPTCAPAHFGRAALAIFAGDTASAEAALALARAADPLVDSLLQAPWQDVPALRARFLAGGFCFRDGRLVRSD